MICPNCQKEIPDTARACGYCGHWLGGEKPSHPPAQSRRNLVWLWVGLGIGAVVIAVALAYMFGRGSSVNTEATVVAALTAARQESDNNTPTAEVKLANEQSTPTSPANTPVSQAANTPEPINTPKPPTNTPKPTNTPRPTPTPTATIDADPSVYDNFNNPANDGSYNKSRWDVYNPLNTCKVAQSDGTLTLSMATAQIEEGCILNGPSDILGDRLNLIEAKMKTLDSKGDVVIVQLVLTSDGFSGGGWASCGLWAYPGGMNAFFSITKQGGQKQEFNKEYSVESNSWHTMRYEIDPDTMTISCFADNKLIGSVIPADAKELKTAVVSRYIQTYLSSNSSGTTFLDDVRVVP